MATPVIMPRQGQSVESCIIAEWNKKKGDKVEIGDILFSYETDKASFEEKATYLVAFELSHLLELSKKLLLRRIHSNSFLQVLPRNRLFSSLRLLPFHYRLGKLRVVIRVDKCQHEHYLSELLLIALKNPLVFT